MEQSKKTTQEQERGLIAYLHDVQNYSYKEISQMPQFKNVSPQAIHKRYKKTKGLTKG